MDTSSRQLTLQVRAASGDGVDPGTVEAFASVYGVEYRVGHGVRERIERGAFDGDDRPVPIFYEHDWKAGPIGVASRVESEEGLRLRGRLFLDDPRARSVHEAMKAGALREWSIGFYALETRQDEDVTAVTRGELLEGSVVVRGANPATDTLLVASEGAREERGCTCGQDDAGDPTEPQAEQAVAEEVSERSDDTEAEVAVELPSELGAYWFVDPTLREWLDDWTESV